MALQLAIARSRQRRTRLLLMGGSLWYLYVRRQHKATRSIWARDWLRRRDDLGAFDTLMSELKQEDQGSFLNFLRMSPGLFDQLVLKVTPLIQRQDTRFRKAISVGIRLAITLRYLATGNKSGIKDDRLDDHAKPLDMQSHYPKGDTRFSLQLEPKVSIVTIKDSCVNSQKDGSVSRTAFITQSTTCQEIIQMVLRTHKIEGHADEYALHQVDHNSKVAHILTPDQRLYDVQQGELDSQQTYLEVQPLDNTHQPSEVRRTHSLREPGPPAKPHVKQVRRPPITEEQEGARRQEGVVVKGDNGGIPHHQTSQDNTMYKLKDSLSKLREHLDNLQQRRGEERQGINLPNPTPQSGHNPSKLQYSTTNHESRAPERELNKSQSVPDDLISRIGRTNSQGFNPIPKSDQTVFSAEEDTGQAMEQYFENLSQSDIVHPVTLLNHDTNDSEDTSLNESDAGSTSASFRGTNDSAYASDRVSLSSQYRRRRRGSQGASSGQSSPESSNLGIGTRALKKAQSMLELERPFQADKPTRVRSATHRGQRTRRKSSTGDDAQNCPPPEDAHSTWARRKQYDMSRRAQTADVRRTRSFTNNTAYRVPGHHDDRPTSATSETSNFSSRSRTRRALPKVPQNADIEERKRKMSVEVLKRVRSNESLNSSMRNSFSDMRFHAVRRESDSSGTEFIPVTDANHNIYKPKPTIMSQSSEFFNGFQPTPQRPVEVYDPQPQLSRKNSTSQEQLQQLIRDLKDAATKPYDGTTGNSRSGSRSSVTSGQNHYDRQESDPNYKQLAQWGVLEPTADDLVGYHKSNKHNSPQNFTNSPSNRHNGHQHFHNSPSSRQHTGSRSLTGSPSSKYSAFNNYTGNQQDGSYYGNDHNSQSGSDIKVVHPSLHRILQSCDLVSVILDKPRSDRDSGEIYDFGLELFESAYSDYDGKEREKRPIFRTPSGRKPIIGRRKGAFMPLKETGVVLSLVAVDVVQEDSVAKNSGNIQEGDFLVEVNGHSVLEWSLKQVCSEVAHSGRTLELVLARPKYTQNQGADNPMVAQVQKELDIMCLKYASLKQDLENNMDCVAELQLELKSRDHRLDDMEHCVKVKDTHIGSMENQLRKKDEDVSSWKYEANQRNLELARLKFEAKQREDRIVQLRRLLIQQTELMQLQGLAQNGDDLEDFEEHVSAV